MALQNYKKNLIRRYEKSPVIRGLIQLLGGISFGVATAFDAAVIQQLNNINEERLRVFFDELDSGSVELTPDLIKTEKFLHCYFATSRAAIRTRRREKIRMFARLLKSSTLPNLLSDADEYEEYLQILDDLSYREILVLSTIENHESTNSISRDRGSYEIRDRSRNWHLLLYDLAEVVNSQSAIPIEEVNAILTRLSRTGCYEILPDDGTGIHNMKDPLLERVGRLAPIYFQLKKLIEDKNGKIA